MYPCYPFGFMWGYCPYFYSPMMINNYYFRDIQMLSNNTSTSNNSANTSNSNNTSTSNSFVPFWEPIQNKSPEFIRNEEYIKKVFARAADRNIFPESDPWYHIFAPVLMMCMNLHTSYDYFHPQTPTDIERMVNSFLDNEITLQIRDLIDNEPSFDVLEYMTIPSLVYNILFTEFTYRASSHRPNHYKHYFNHQ